MNDMPVQGTITLEDDPGFKKRSILMVTGSVSRVRIWLPVFDETPGGSYSRDNGGVESGAV